MKMRVEEEKKGEDAALLFSLIPHDSEGMGDRDVNAEAGEA